MSEKQSDRAGGGNPRGRMAPLAAAPGTDVSQMSPEDMQQLVDELQARQGSLELENAELRHSEARYRLMVETANEGIWAMDADFRTTYVNPVMADMLGYRMAEMLGQPVTAFMFPRDLSDHDRQMAQRRQGLDGKYERRFQRQDGGEIWAMVSTKALMDDRGQFQGAFAMLTDLTARRQAEEALRDREERLQSKLDSLLTPDAEIDDLDLSDILDTPVVQALMEDLHRLTGMANAIIDLKGKVLVATGWHDICTQYHRVHPEAARACIDSDIFLTQDLRPGEYRIYKCRHHLCDAVTPLFIGGKHVCNVFAGQFLFEDEAVDEAVFQEQAARYGFDREEYLSALQRVPRCSREQVKALTDFLVKFAGLVSQLSNSNLKLARAISQQQRIEAALRRSEDYFRQLTKLSPVPIAVIDLEGDIEYVNDRFMTTFGYTLDDIPNMAAWWRLAYPDERYRSKGMAAWEKDRHWLTGEPPEMTPRESRVTCKDGAVRIVEIFGARIGDKTLVVLQDITERHQAKEALRQAAHKWRTTFDAIGDAVSLMDPEGRILQCNQAMLTLVGHPFQEIIGQHCWKLVHEASEPVHGCPLVRVRQSRQREELLLPIADRWWKVTVDPILNAAGDLMGVVHLIADITLFKQAEAALQQSQQMLQLVLDSIPVGVFWKDRELRYLGCNRFNAQAASLPHPQDIVGKTDFDLPWKDLAEQYRADDRQVMDTGTPKIGFEEKITLSDGSRRWLQTNKVPLRHQDGQIFGVLGTYEDITARKQVEAEIIEKRNQLRALGARLAEVEEAERQLLARELHDQVCQSLTALGLNLTLLQTQMPRETAAAILNRLSDAMALVEQMGESVRDVMAELRPPMLDDYGLLSALRWYGAEFSRRTGIGVEVRGEEATPRLDGPVEMGLFRIAQEALTNVAKHAQASRVVLTQEVDHGGMRLVIADNGVGFDQAQLGQPEGRHRWGLMTMGERAMAVGGRYHIESRPGQGTRVVVEVSR